jgi:aminopeptidase N
MQVMRAARIAVGLMGGVLTFTAAAQGATPSPTPLDPALVGSRSRGDRFYPTLGNGGYDITHYDLDLTWHAPSPSDAEGHVEGLARLDLVTTQDLVELSLDLVSDTAEVRWVRVDGTTVRHRSDALGRKLIVPLGTPRAPGAEVTLDIAWSAIPGGVHRLGEGIPLPVSGAARARDARGFLTDGDGGFLMASQPDGAHTLFPSNDHPTDKATFTVRLTAPAGMLGVATGQRVEQVAHPDGSTTTTWASEQPVATHVLAMGVGRSAIVESAMADGPHLRSVVPEVLAPISGYRLDDLDDAVRWVEDELGVPFPFGSIGVQLAPPGATGAVLEGQTLILAGAGLLDPRVDACAWRGLLVHEVAHQWFGDSVSLVGWDEKWLSEGHATWYQRRYEAESGCDPLGFDRRMALTARRAQAVRDAGGPPAQPKGPADAYDATIYDQGALAIEALRREVGDGTFRAIESAWTERYRDASASTDDFIDLASETAGRDLGPSLDAWLRGDVVPPLPADPDASPSPAAILPPVGTGHPADQED